MNRTSPLTSSDTVPFAAFCTDASVRLSPSTSPSFANRADARIVTGVSATAFALSAAAVGSSLTGATFTVTVAVSVATPSVTV